MKPEQARAMRRRQDAERAARGEALESYLQAGEGTGVVVPDLIPDEVTLTVARREVRQLIRRAERTPRGPGRAKVLDDLLFALARLVYVERVMKLDRLQRAALTPAKLAALSRMRPEELRARLEAMRAPAGVSS